MTEQHQSQPALNLNQHSNPTDLPDPDIGISDRLSGDVPIKNLPVSKGKKKETGKPIETAEEVAPGALSPSHQKKAEQLATVYADAGVLVIGFNPIAGKMIFVTAMERATEVLRVARHHPRMMAVVDRIINGNDYFALAFGHATMFASIMALQGRLPDTPMTQRFLMQGQLTLARWDLYESAMMAAQNGQQPTTVPGVAPA